MLRSFCLANGCTVACALLLLGAAGCGRIADDAGTGGASSSGGASAGSGGVSAASGGQVGAGGSLGGPGAGGGLVIPPEIITDLPPPVEDYLDAYRLDAPFESDLPDIPEDYVPPLPVGEPGWRDSTETFCSELLLKQTTGIWADAEGVAVLTASCQATLDSFCESGTELWYNDGSGWEWLLGLQDADTTSILSGVAGGDLLFRGSRAVAMGRDGEAHGGSPDEAGYVMSLFGDGTGPAYGTFHENTTAPEAGHLYRYGDGAWTDLATYADPTYAQDLVVVGDVAYAVLGSAIGRAALGSAFEAIPDVPPQDYMVLGALAEDDLWTATFEGAVLHYDGDSLTEIGEVEGGVLQFQAVEDEMYFISETTFGRVTGSEIEVIQELDELATFQGLAGVASDEVFVAVMDEELEDYDCTGLEVFVYDGEQFHQF